MGRPALYLLRTHVSFSAEALHRMDALVGEKGRAKFIREAVDKLLDAVEYSRKPENEAKKTAP